MPSYVIRIWVELPAGDILMSLQVLPVGAVSGF